MAKGRFSDADLRLMTRLSAALKDAMEGDLGYRDWLYGKWAVTVSDIERELATREAERRMMFVPPMVQLLNLSRWNQRRGWGFSEDDITVLMDEIPAEPAGPEEGKLQLKARVLEIHLPDGPDGMPGYRRTFDELWDIAVQEHGARPFHLFGLGPNVRLALPDGVVHAPGLRWRVIDFGAHWPPDPECVRHCGTAPRSLPPDAERVGAGLLAAAAHFPLWLARMDGKHVPYVWLPGYRLPGVPHAINVMGTQPIHHHPVLTRNGPEGKMFLYYHWDHVPFEDYAVPAYAEAPASAVLKEGDGEGG